jgi:hypothetical protein
MVAGRGRCRRGFGYVLAAASSRGTDLLRSTFDGFVLATVDDIKLELIPRALESFLNALVVYRLSSIAL